MKTRRTVLPAALAGVSASGYTGADVTRRALKEWDVRMGSADADTLSDLPTLRGYSSDLIRNEPLASGALRTCTTDAVGTGLRVQSRVNAAALGISPEAALDFQDRAEELWEAVRDQLDWDRVSGWRGQLILAFRSRWERGDALVVRRYARNPGDILGTKVQLIEADRVSNPRGRWDGPRLRQGVEYDERGALAAYHVANHHPGDFLHHGASEWARIAAFGAASGERQAMLLFDRDRIGQSRGVPRLAPVIELFKQLGRYTEAEVMAAVVNALFTVFIEHTEMDDPEADVAPMVDASADDEDGTGNGVGGEFKMGSGTVLDLEPGAKPNLVAPQRPNTAFGPFIDSILMQAGAALGVPFEVLTKRFQASYSAARAALLMHWREMYGERESLIDGFCRPVWSWVIAEGVARGILEAPGFFQDPLRRAAWLRAEWTGDAPGAIDEVKEAKAAEIRMAAQLTTLQEETQQLTGGDWERNLEQRARERDRRTELGLPEPAPPGKAEAPAKDSDEEEEE